MNDNEIKTYKHIKSTSRIMAYILDGAVLDLSPVFGTDSKIQYSNNEYEFTINDRVFTADNLPEILQVSIDVLLGELEKKSVQ